MIACISPAHLTTQATRSSMRTAPKHKTRIESNVHNVSFHIHKYNEIISQLHEEIVGLPVGHHTIRSENVDSFILEINKH